MANKERAVTDGFSPLMFMVHFLETIAVVLFLVMALGMSGQSSEDRLAVLEMVGILALFAWLIRRIDKVVQIAAYVLDTLLDRLLRSLTNVAPAASSSYEPIELKNLCSWHKNSFCVAIGVFMLVLLAALVLFSMFSLAEGSPVTSTVWDWTYRITMPILGICLVWMLATLFHARRRCASKFAQPRTTADVPAPS